MILTEIQFYQIKAKEMGIEHPKNNLDDLIDQILEFSGVHPERILTPLENEWDYTLKEQQLKLIEDTVNGFNK